MYIGHFCKKNDFFCIFLAWPPFWKKWPVLMGKWGKNMQNSEFVYFSSKSGKHMKQMLNPPFWGDVGVKKWSPILDSGARSPIFGHLEMGKVPTFRCPKMGLARIQKRRTLFHANIPPKWWMRHLFYAFTTFGWVISQFWNMPNLGQFWAIFPWARAKF